MFIIFALWRLCPYLTKNQTSWPIFGFLIIVFAPFLIFVVYLICEIFGGKKAPTNTGTNSSYNIFYRLFFALSSFSIIFFNFFSMLLFIAATCSADTTNAASSLVLFDTGLKSSRTRFIIFKSPFSFSSFLY